MPQSITSLEDSKDAIISRCARDPYYMARTFFSEWFPHEAPWVHLGVLALMTGRCKFLLNQDEEKLRQITRHFQYKTEQMTVPVFEFAYDHSGRPVDVIMRRAPNTMVYMPRGFSKTTWTNFATIYKIVFRVRKFVVYISESSSHATAQLANVRQQFEANNELREVFGEFRPVQRQNKKWTDDELQFENDCILVARGRGQQIRGLNRNGRRPDSIVLDDVEDLESVQTKAQRDKTRAWFFGDAMPASGRFGDSEIIALGTLLHRDALLTYLEQDPEFNTIKFSVEDLDGNMLWPEAFSYAKLEREKRRYQLAGQLSTFYLEYYNEVRNPETQSFKPEHIIVGRSAQMTATAIAVDPDISQSSEKTGKSVIAVAGIGEDGFCNALDFWSKNGASPYEIVEEYMRLSKLWKCYRHGVESIAYQAALIHVLQHEMPRHGHYFNITPITHGHKRKETRILGVLQPLYNAGYFRHRLRWTDLESELLDFPNGMLDHVDALAMAVSLLDDYTGHIQPEELVLEDESDEYAPIKTILGEWRAI